MGYFDSFTAWLHCSALRLWHRALRTWRGRSCWPSFPAAAQWLQRQAEYPTVDLAQQRLRIATLARLLPVTHAIGLDRWVEEIFRRLHARQRADGALPDDVQAAPSLWNTAQFVRALLACDGLDQGATLRACEYLCAALAGRASIASHASEPQDLSAQTIQLAALAALAAGARRWSRPEWGAAVLQHLARIAHEDDLSGPRASEQGSRCAEAWLELHRTEEAARLLAQAAQQQERDGLLPEGPNQPFTRTANLALWMELWARQGWRRAAQRAAQALALAQQSDGSLRALIGPHAPDATGQSGLDDSLEAVANFLHAALARVAAAFAAPAVLPAHIDPSDGRALAVVAWLQRLPAAPQVVDVGCGRGRFLSLIARQRPAARLTGIDVSPAMLAQLPPQVARRRGSLLRIPAADASFDGALAIESLEHALWPQRAVVELCRVVRPGGRVLIIDKHHDKQARSLCDPWEQWFAPEQLQAWLSAFCDDVRVHPVPHSEGRPAQDLFLAAEGRRR